MKTMFIAAVVAFAASTAVTAQDLPTRTVSYADLNLSSPAGRATLASRIDAAAKAVCVGLTQGSDLASHHAYRTCRQQATTTAFAALERSNMVQLASR